MSSFITLALIIILPAPFDIASLIPSRPWTIPPVGKSGPLIYFNKSFSLILGFFKYAIVAFITSFKLCGGIFVA